MYVCMVTESITITKFDVCFQNQPQVQRGFLEILVKDIKTMIQFSPL